MGIITVNQSDCLFWLGRYIERVYTTLRMYNREYDRLIDEMVACALRAHAEKERNSFAFTSDILSGVQLGGAKGGKMGGKMGGKLKL